MLLGDKFHLSVFYVLRIILEVNARPEFVILFMSDLCSVFMKKYDNVSKNKQCLVWD